MAKDTPFCYRMPRNAEKGVGVTRHPLRNPNNPNNRPVNLNNPNKAARLFVPASIHASFRASIRTSFRTSFRPSPHPQQTLSLSGIAN